MNYDISTTENCLNTLQELTNYSYWNDIYEKYQYTYTLYPDEVRDIIIKQNNIKLAVTSKELFFVLLHITTSANNCEDIKNKGIYDLEWVIENDTELSRFLYDNGITFDIQNQLMYVDDIPRNIAENDIGFKIYKDKDICGCFQIDKKIPYGGNVHFRPEILHNIDESVSGKDLSYIWHNTHKPYIIKFQVPYSNMDIALQMSVKNDSEEKILNGLLNWAIDIFFCRDCSSDRIGILKRDVFVPPSDIISIIEY